MEKDNPIPAAEGTQQVPFDSGCLGCLFLLLVPIAALMAVAVVDGEFVDTLAHRDTRRNLFAAIEPLHIGGINIGALGLAGVLGWEVIRVARRFLGRTAVWIEGEVIRFHPTLRYRALPLVTLESITHKADHASSTLWLQTEGGKRIKIPMVDHDAAAAFVAEVERAKAALTFG